MKELGSQGSFVFVYKPDCIPERVGEECARVCMWVSLSVSALDHSVQHLLSFPPSAVHASVAFNGNMTHPPCSPEHIFAVRNTLEP